MFEPWLAPLMRQRLLCRLLMVTSGVLGLGAWKGWQMWPCLFAKLTGLPCHGCGLTRAFLALAQGNWWEMLLLHPFAPFFALTGLLCAVVACLPSKLAGKIIDKVEAFEGRTKVPAVVLILFVCFGLLRMAGFWYQPLLPEPMGAFKRAAAATGVQKR